MPKRKKYDKEFKLNAIQFYEESGKKLRDVEDELGIGAGSKPIAVLEFGISETFY